MTAAAATGVDAHQEQSAGNSVDTAGTTDTGGVRILYLYSGPHRPDDGLTKYLQELGAECVCVDKEFNNEHDLLDQQFWEDCRDSFCEYDGFLISPPCSTFTPARRGQGGPKPLRGINGADRYGLKGLGPREKKQVTEGTILALRAENTATYAQTSGRWWIVEQPHERPGKPSMWKLDEFDELKNREGVYLYTFDQCRYGCMAEKKTDLLSNIPGLEEFTLLCNHEIRRWIIPWSGEVIVAPHPPLKGRQWAIPEAEWSPSMLCETEPTGDYITRACAAYPSELNKALAKALLRRRKQAPNHEVREQDQRTVEQAKVTKLMPLRGKEDSDKPHDSSNSLRDVHRWVTDKAKYIGIQVRNIVFRLFDQRPDIEVEILESLGKRSNEDILRTTWMQDLRLQVADLLVRNRKPDQTCTHRAMWTRLMRTATRRASEGSCWNTGQQ